MENSTALLNYFLKYEADTRTNRVRLNEQLVGAKAYVPQMQFCAHSVQLQERRVARLAAGVDAIALTCRMPQRALLQASFSPVACQLLKRSRSLCKCRYNKNQDFNLLTFCGIFLAFFFLFRCAQRPQCLK
jgi:hypothetical protein